MVHNQVPQDKQTLELCWVFLARWARPDAASGSAYVKHLIYAYMPLTHIVLILTAEFTVPEAC